MRTTARATTKVIVKSVAIGLNVGFVVWDSINIYSTWKNDSETAKKIKQLLEELE